MGSCRPHSSASVLQTSRARAPSRPTATPTAALARQGTRLEKGDVVIVRTGRMRHFKTADRYMKNPPGLRLDAARYLVVEGGAMILGGDNLSLETFSVETSDNWTWLLAERGVPIMEVVDVQALADDRVYEFAFIGASLKLKGASGSPMRPIAIPLASR